jgi:hypothetical protein
MPHAMDLGGVSVNAVGLVAPHGAVFPARLPQLIDDRHVFVGGIATLLPPKSGSHWTPRWSEVDSNFPYAAR